MKWHRGATCSCWRVALRLSRRRATTSPERRCGATARCPSAQPDTLLYCQAARRIVEGAPFSYSAGTAACTGTTSVIYPFILAVPYALGLKGDLLVTAGFVLNAAFYLIFLLGWCSLACRIFAGCPAGRFLSVALVATFGPFAYCALAQSDIGLWMAVSAWLAYGLYCDRKHIYVPLLLLAPWVRPEGMIVALSVVGFATLKWLIGSRRVSRDLLLNLLILSSVVGVFALNYAITGECQFSSVAHKGHFKNLSFTSAAYASAIDLMRIAKAYLLGLPQNAPRDFCFLPLIGAACMWIGLFARRWSDVSWREFSWYLAMAGGIATVATSGWQNTNLDRYLIWIMPVLILYMAHGANALAVGIWQLVVPMDHNGRARSPSAPIPAILLLAFNLVMAVVFVWIFRHSSAGADASRNFAARCEEYANWPVIALYDWLLMLNVQAINEKGYYISPANVTWYRAIGEPDDMHDAFPQDDEVVTQGSYYLTLDKSLQGTGNYYAIVDVSDAKGQLCDGLMRTVIINYSGSDASSACGSMRTSIGSRERLM